MARHSQPSTAYNRGHHLRRQKRTPQVAEPFHVACEHNFASLHLLLCFMRGASEQPTIDIYLCAKLQIN
jgi:hypothetical protein